MIFEKTIMKMYRNRLLVRHDPDGTVKYFAKEDFAGLMSEDFSFLGDKGQRLSAHIYKRDSARCDRLIIFDHGMGCGHVAYLKEINLLTEHGYLVATYDHTGTYRSEGEHIGGFSQSLSDLDHFIDHLREKDEYRHIPISVIGHSWGGFSTLNIPKLHPDITHIVALSGFISPKEIQAQNLGGVLALYRQAAFDLEKQALPKYYDFDARNSLLDVGTKALIIHSKDDAIVNYNRHFKALESVWGRNGRMTFLTLDGKNHNPNYTEDAIQYEKSFFCDLKGKLKAKHLSTDEEKKSFIDSYDWDRMTAQDMELWDKIFAFLEK